jgi:hypothetical protein
MLRVLLERLGQGRQNCGVLPEKNDPAIMLSAIKGIRMRHGIDKILSRWRGRGR